MQDGLLVKLLQAIAASILGWVLVQLPRLSSRKTTWLSMVSYVGIAALIGFIVYSLVTFFWPSAPQPVVCSISSLLGAACDRVMPKLLGFAEKATDKVGGAFLEEIGKPAKSNPDQEKPEN